MTKYIRPEVIDGFTYKIKVPNNRQDIVALYLTINHDENGKPIEIFIRCDDPWLFEHMNALSIMTSGMLQIGVHLKDIAAQLATVYSPHTAHFIAGVPVECPSVYARIAHELNKHILEMRTYNPIQTNIEFAE